mmetsp:Transcript_5719/g.13681  ORF Transcript_5719/g.13681 Transcript_5719/m.13681 type:complete len:204 (+) Transcript_5719:2611-3222(+)
MILRLLLPNRCRVVQDVVVWMFRVMLFTSVWTGSTLRISCLVRFPRSPERNRNILCFRWSVLLLLQMTQVTPISLSLTTKARTRTLPLLFARSSVRKTASQRLPKNKLDGWLAPLWKISATAPPQPTTWRFPTRLLLAWVTPTKTELWLWITTFFRWYRRCTSICQLRSIFAPSWSKCTFVSATKRASNSKKATRLKTSFCRF